MAKRLLRGYSWTNKKPKGCPTIVDSTHNISFYNNKTVWQLKTFKNVIPYIITIYMYFHVINTHYFTEKDP